MSTRRYSVVHSARWSAGAVLALAGALSALAQEYETGQMGPPVRWSDIVALEQQVQKLAGPPELHNKPEPKRPPIAVIRGQLPSPERGIIREAQRQPAGPALGPKRGDPQLGRNFLGIVDDHRWIPPDTMGAVGVNHIVTMLNSEVRIHTKDGQTLSTVRLETFWSAGGLNGQPFDPHILFDPYAQRWLATCDANPQMTSAQIYIALSDTADPTGTWRFKFFNADNTQKSWADYPGLGFNKKWYVFSNNMFSMTNDFVGAKLWVVDREKVLSSGTFTAKVFSVGFDLIQGEGGFTLKPCETYDLTADNLYIVDNYWYDGDLDKMLVRVSELYGEAGSPFWRVVDGSQFEDTGLFPVVNDFSPIWVGATQKGSSETIETNDFRVLNAVYRNGHIWFAHTGSYPYSWNPEDIDRTVAVWYEVHPARLPEPLVQSGVIDGGKGVHCFFPSVAVNDANDACVGFTRSSADIFAEAAFTARSVSDPLGTMRSIIPYKEGEAAYTLDRWGDYSATCVDPADNRTFWTIQEYPKPGNTWSTWWAEVRMINDCNGNGIADELDLANCDGSTWCKDCNGNGQIDVCEQLQPLITLQPQPVEACLGAEAKFSVTATGNGELKYQWRKDGTPIEGATASTYTIPAAQLSDAAAYDVMVSDGCTSDLFAPATSNAAQLTILQLLINSQPQPTVAVAGQSATLTVVAAGPAPLTYQWRHKGQPIDGAIGASYLIQMVRPEDAGAYDVVVGSPCGSLESSAATLTVSLGELAGPYPLDKAENVPIAGQVLGWAAVFGATEYRVYFGTTQTPGLLTNSVANTVTMPALSYSTRYFWRVEARYGDLLSTGPLWSFTTEPMPPQPPAAPTDPFPADGATNVELNARLTWGAAEGAQIYKVLLSLDPDFADVLFDGSTISTRWTPETFEPKTTYYWRILAKNGVGTTAGPVWSFTTGAKADSGTDQPQENENENESGQDIPNGNDNAAENDNATANSNGSGNAPTAPLCPLSAGLITALSAVGVWLTRPRRR